MEQILKDLMDACFRLKAETVAKKREILDLALGRIKDVSNHQEEIKIQNPEGGLQGLSQPQSLNDHEDEESNEDDQEDYHLQSSTVDDNSYGELIRVPSEAEQKKLGLAHRYQDLGQNICGVYPFMMTVFPVLCNRAVFQLSSSDYKDIKVDEIKSSSYYGCRSCYRIIKEDEIKLKQHSRVQIRCYEIHGNGKQFIVYPEKHNSETLFVIGKLLDQYDKVLIKGITQKYNSRYFIDKLYVYPEQPQQYR